MSWWNAQYTNSQGEYEITFGTKDYKKVKTVEKVCCAVIDKDVNSPDDVEIVRHGRWVTNNRGFAECTECKFERIGIPLVHRLNYCPNCGAKMDLEE